MTIDSNSGISTFTGCTDFVATINDNSGTIDLSDETNTGTITLTGTNSGTVTVADGVTLVDATGPQPTPQPTHGPTPEPTRAPTSPAYTVTGDLSFSGMAYADAVENEAVFVAAIADIAGVADDQVSVEFTMETAERRRRLDDSLTLVVSYVIQASTETFADAVTATITASDVDDVDTAIASTASTEGATSTFAAVSERLCRREKAIIEVVLRETTHAPIQTTRARSVAFKKSDFELLNPRVEPAETESRFWLRSF